MTFANAANTSTPKPDRFPISATDSSATPTTGSSASESINVSAPVTISRGLCLGQHRLRRSCRISATTAWASSTYGLPSQTGLSAAQLATLPWFNVNTITVTFSSAACRTSARRTSSIWSKDPGGDRSAAVSGFASLGNNAYQWTLGASLTNNRYVFAIATTGSSFGTVGSTQVVDANGAGISGKFATGQNFPSGNGLAATVTSPSTFDFFFNVLPGDVNRDDNDNGTDLNLVRPLAINTRATSSSYNPYYDVNGDGTINGTDLSLIRPDSGRLASGSPTAPSVAGVGGLDMTPLALGVQESGGSTPSSGSSAGNATSAAVQTSASSASLADESERSSTSNRGGEHALARRDAGSFNAGGSEPCGGDAALVEFDLADLWA